MKMLLLVNFLLQEKAISTLNINIIQVTFNTVMYNTSLYSVQHHMQCINTINEITL